MKELPPEVVDINGETPNRVQAAAFCAARDLRPGESVAPLTA